jgi:glycosyltransferase involved in cell wall biosynthesis
VTVTPNGVDHSLFHPITKQKTPDLPKTYILFVGSLEPRKNLDLLLHVWGNMKDDFKGTWLIVVGSSGNVFRAVNLPTQMERIRFLGYVEDEALAGLYANAALLVLPSQDEGFGLPALEAMASGTPVIVSDGGALPETVGDAGLIFNLCQSESSEESQKLSGVRSLTRVLRECLRDTGLRSMLRQKGLARAEQFSWQTTAELVWKDLNEL